MLLTLRLAECYMENRSYEYAPKHGPNFPHLIVFKADTRKQNLIKTILFRYKLHFIFSYQKMEPRNNGCEVIL
jgi:hypothetical protein